MSLMRRTIFVCAMASLGVIAWKNLNKEQRVSLTDAVNSGRRKLANFIAPQEDLGNLTDRFDPGFLEALISDDIKYQDSVHQPESLDCDPGDRIDPEP